MPKTIGVYRQDNGTWYFKARTTKHPVTGQRDQVTRRGFATATEASDARRRFLEEAERGEHTRPSHRSSLTVSELVERYHTDAEALGDLTDRTLYDQRGYLRNSIGPHIGSLAASELTSTVVRSWMVKLATDGGKNGNGLSANTIRLCRSLLRSAYEWGVENELVDSNPVAATSPPKKRKKVPEHWTPEEARKFLGFHEGDRLYPVWAFMLATGVRPSDFVWLRWINVELASGIVRLQDFATAIGWKLVPSDGKNATTTRTIELDLGTISILQQHSERQATERQASGYEPSDYVFTKLQGGCYHPQTLSKTLAKESERLGLPRLTAKGLRHTSATIMLAHGVPPKVAAERLGHADTRMFSNVYSHVTPTMQREAAASLGRALFDNDP